MRTAPLSPLAPRSPYPAREERPETAAIRTVRPEEPAGFPAADAFDLSVGAPATVPEASPLGRPKTEREVLEALDGLLSHPEVFRACEVLTEASPGRAPAVQIAEGELSAVSDRDEGAYAVTFRWAGPRTLEVIHDRPFGGSTEPRRRTLGGKGEGFEVIERWNVPFAGRLADGTLVEARYPRRANLYSRRIFGKTLTGEDYRQLVGARPGAYIRISAQHESEDRLEVRVVSDGQTWLFSRGTEGQGPRVELVGWTRREVDGPGAETRALARALPALDAHGVKEIVTRVGMQSEKLLGNKDWSRVGFRRESPSRGELDAWHDAGGMRELTFNLGPGSASRARLERLRRSAEQNLDLPRTSAARATDEGLPTTGADFVPPTPSVSGRPTALPSRRVIEGLKAIHTFLGRRIPLSAYAQLAEGPAQGHVEVWATPDRMTIAVDGGTVPYITTVRSPRKGVLEVFRDVPSLLGTPTPGLGHEQPSLSRHRRVGPLKLEEHWYAATEDTLADGTRVLADHPHLTHTSARAIFGRPLTAEDYRTLLAAPAGSEILVTAHSKESPFITVDVRHPLYRAMQHDFYWNPYLQGPEAHHSLWIKRDHAPAGLGAQVFAETVEAYERYGVKLITLQAAQGKGYVGAWVWPKLGFNAPLPEELREDLPPALRDCETVLDLLERPGGEAAWRRVARTLDMVFSIEPGSQSRETLRRYLESRRG